MRRTGRLIGCALLIGACTALTQRPNLTPTPPAASATPAHSAGTQTLQPSATATPPPPATARPASPAASIDPGQILERFAGVSDDGRAPFRLRAHRLIDDGAMTVKGAVRGLEFAGELRLELVDFDETIGVVIVDETTWMLDPTRGWRKAPVEMDIVQPINPLVGGVATFGYLRTIPRGDMRVHILRTTEWTGAAFIGPFRNLRIASTVLDVYVTDEGVPLDGHIEYVVVGRALGIDDVFLSVRINYNFSEFGAPVTIEEPVEGTPGIPG